MPSADLVSYWNEDKLEPRYGRVVEVLDGGAIVVEGCAPRLGDAICIVGSAEESVDRAAG